MRWLFVFLACGAGCGTCKTEEDSQKGEKKLDESKMPGAADVRAFAKTAGIEPKQLRCANIGDSKAFTCRTGMSETEVTQLATSWGLKPDDPKDNALMRGKKFGCEGFNDFKPDTGWKAWASTAKPEKLAGVEYTRIYFRPDTDKVCIEMEKTPPPPQ